MSFARGFVAHSLDGKKAIFYHITFTTSWERDAVGYSSHDKLGFAAEVAEAVTKDAYQRHKFKDCVGEGIVLLTTDESEGPEDDGDEQLYAVWKQLKGTAFVLVVPESTNLTTASYTLSTLIKLLQSFYGHKNVEFESRDLLLRPEIAYTIVSRVYPNGLVQVLDITLLRQTIKKALDPLK
eukprot:TRINITY_DN25973_c0_g1_i1.p1 TRINITY_DN25973_c0_g1~~TRINITY_DN25973_c0_g1_i1.p1  ORF type:complete len:181 (+),score=37.03 TRINITY_DN25973_c0_g1_i1:577-1119(+)